MSEVQKQRSRTRMTGLNDMQISILQTSLSTSLPLGSPLAAELVHHLSSQSLNERSLRQLGCFISMVPQRLGRNDALDLAVECLCAAHSCFLSSGQNLSPSKYAKALKCVRKSLDKSDEALSSEVLCAIICLSWCEVSGWRPPPGFHASH